MKKRFLSMMIIFILILTSCRYSINIKVHNNGKDKENQSVDNGSQNNTITVKNLGYELPKPKEFYSTGGEYTPLEIEANVPDIKIQSALSNVENLSQFGNLNDVQKEMIEKNGFVVNPTDSQQLFYIYEANTYNRIPSFITTDSVLQLYHIFYDYTLRQTEAEKLYIELKELNKNMVEILVKKYQDTKNQKDKELVGKTLAYFALCEKLLGEESNLPDEIKTLVEADYANVRAESKAVSSITGSDVDYSLFKVRGHYTRSDELKAYFGAMSVYGVVPFVLYDATGKRDEDGAYMSIIATEALEELPKEKGMDLWEDIYTITEFFVGSTNDINPLEFGAIVKAVYGEMPEPKDISGGMDKLYAELDKVGQARIKNSSIGLCFRFMGQRYIPDSEILSRLSNEKRPFPSGLDVMAVFGSQRAEELLDSLYNPSKEWDDYKKEYNKVKSEFDERSIKDKTGNIYTTWLYSLESLNQRFPEGYPSFMRNKAWESKSLSTALGSWSELRHDTILYGAQSSVECGGEEEEPPKVTGYVEPNPEFYNRLIWLTKQTMEGLSQRNGISDSMKNKCENIIELLEFLKNCSIKELKGESLTYEENDTLMTYGGTLEYLSSSIAEAQDWYQVASDTDKNMAQIADIHSANTDKGSGYLEVGVGNAAEIYVVVPIDGKLYLTRGAVFDYFEFISNERLTDESWQNMVNRPPKRLPFVGDYMQEEEGEEIITPEVPYSSGC
ncbi:DUF3160 domain-containing protein [Lachnoanaerobaculum sp. OBRC5-5]|uniref:DUF3160 domain-containing protein n=1 Tax=Lachnoanaerobaculum sp. OBRC5-5 TaxID=936595 RepID=UPI00028256C6|nr:DUF3160 domain-containing protein [Lachnoanaerobaculum sp. OBRC5-5]EJZ70217.1 hypothetical protein HMPREF1135_01053 [Lachnoanaerobaculum sp. OBRC5-5]